MDQFGVWPKFLDQWPLTDIGGCFFGPSRLSGLRGRLAQDDINELTCRIGVLGGAVPGIGVRVDLKEIPQESHASGIRLVPVGPDVVVEPMGFKPGI